MDGASDYYYPYDLEKSFQSGGDSVMNYTIISDRSSNLGA